MFSLINIAIGIIISILISWKLSLKDIFPKIVIFQLKIEKLSAKIHNVLSIVNKPHLLYQRIKMIKMN